MEKKLYTAPETELIKMEALAMVVASIGIGEGEADAGGSFTIEHRGTWGNLWKK